MPVKINTDGIEASSVAKPARFGCTDVATALPLLHPPADLLAMLTGDSEGVLVTLQRGRQRFAPLQDVEL